jgi:hypothetical protein
MQVFFSDPSCKFVCRFLRATTRAVLHELYERLTAPGKIVIPLRAEILVKFTLTGKNNMMAASHEAVSFMAGRLVRTTFLMRTGTDVEMRPRWLR